MTVTSPTFLYSIFNCLEFYFSKAMEPPIGGQMHLVSSRGVLFACSKGHLVSSSYPEPMCLRYTQSYSANIWRFSYKANKRIKALGHEDELLATPPRCFVYIDSNDEIAFYFRTLPQSSFLGNGCTQTLFKHILGIYIKKKHAHMI